MPRTYIRKTAKAKAYTKETLEKALHEIRTGKYRVINAARRYNIPVETLQSRIRGNRGTKSSNMGRPLALPPESEKTIVQCLHILEKCGRPLSRLEILDFVGEFVRRNKIKTPFRNGVPGADWFINFKKRHGLKVKKVIGGTKTQAWEIFEFFDKLKRSIRGSTTETEDPAEVEVVSDESDSGSDNDEEADLDSFLEHVSKEAGLLKSPEAFGYFRSKVLEALTEAKRMDQNVRI